MFFQVRLFCLYSATLCNILFLCTIFTLCEWKKKTSDKKQTNKNYLFIDHARLVCGVFFSLFFCQFQIQQRVISHSTCMWTKAARQHVEHLRSTTTIRYTPVRQKPGRGGWNTGTVPVTDPLQPFFVLPECQGEGDVQSEDTVTRPQLTLVTVHLSDTAATDPRHSPPV